MKTFFKIIGTFFALIIMIGVTVSASSHARVAAVQHGAKQDIDKMLIKHETIKQEIMTPIPGDKK